MTVVGHPRALEFIFGKTKTVLKDSWSNWMAQDARALAKGNNIFGDQQNAIEHSFVSATMTIRYGEGWAEFTGDMLETFGGSSPADEASW